ncbi:DEAD/DEAH box helicase [Pseudoflavitalea sp. G-6-1-2]|uniref:DEAD/DEAH box helicase n=1 Tax=Pseudoflavitalea sp. G-6-1-2 TaxID=2728841 RepID=UPI00146A4107|nr:DEAD/DEAH box helicase [Pseudoflavitalea sp. G-6-1-2]NML22240.1 DEAD/DEAH box helicase [Pseudoflavitalea sp. G-6-1-2]
MSFEQLAIAAPILKALAAKGYSEPTPIQEQSIPVILQQKDVLGCARTGTGKTAAFAIPVIQLLAEEKATQPVKGIRALVLTPTRELALQIQENFEEYGKYTNIRQVVIFGGVSQQSQVSELRRGADVLIATPGRLMDLMQQGIVDISKIRILVLDEADRMLDMGFIHDVKKVIARTPAQKQTLFFSATMAPEIRKLSDTILRNPVAVQVTPVASTAETVAQSLYFVDKKNKNSLLVHILQNPEISASIVFSRTKHGANKIVKALENAGIRAEAIHGNKSQSARQRALQLLKEREIRVLVATDIAARGIDVEELSHVINYDLPNVPETYVHRIGRTGRAGASGLAISFCDHEEKEFLRDIQKLIKKSVPVVEDHPFKFGSPIVKETVSTAPAFAKNQPGTRDIRNKQQKGKQQGNGQGARPSQQRQHNQPKQHQSKFQQPNQQRRPQQANHQQLEDNGPKTWQELLDAENEMMNQASNKWNKSNGQQQRSGQQSSQKNTNTANKPFNQHNKNRNGFRGNNQSRNNHNG